MDMDTLVKGSNVDTVDINSLPNEVILKIFGHLTHNPLGQIARVCKKWNVLTRSPILWRRVDVILYEHHESQTEAVEKLIAMLSCCVTHINLDFRDIYSWTGRLNFSELSVRFQEKCPHIEALILEDAKLSESLLLVIDLCTRLLQNIKVLVIRFSEFPDSPAKTEFDGISKIEVLDVSWCDFGLFNQPPFSKMTYLKQLHVADTKVDDSCFEAVDDSCFEADTSFLGRLEVLDLGRTEIGCQTFRSIRNHGENLRELYLCWMNLQDNDLKFSNSVFPHLKTICLRYCCTVTCEDVVSVIQSCHSLENVYVTQEVAHSFAAHPFNGHNRCKLGIVKIIPCEDHQKMYY